MLQNQQLHDRTLNSLSTKLFRYQLAVHYVVYLVRSMHYPALDR